MPSARARVVMTVHRFFPHVGGTEEHVRQVGRRLVARGYDVTVATSREGDAPLQETIDGIDVRRFPLRRLGKFRFPTPEYVRFVVDGPWDVIHLHGQRVWCGDHLFKPTRRARAPVVFTPHGFYQWHVGKVPLVDDYYYRVRLPRRLRHVRRIVCHTAREREEVVGFGVPRDRTVVVPAGYDSAEFARPAQGFRERHGRAGKPLLLYVGGFYPNKRVDRLVQAVATSGTGARLVVLGKDHGGRHGARDCQRLADRLGVDYQWLGSVPRADVLSAYSESDLFLLGSDFEGFGLVLLEAMAAGLPFVSTPCGTAPELAALGAGRVAPDTPAMATAIRELLADAPLRRSMSQRARQAVTAFDWDRCADRYEELYAPLAARR